MLKLWLKQVENCDFESKIKYLEECLFWWKIRILVVCVFFGGPRVRVRVRVDVTRTCKKLCFRVILR